MYGSIDTPEVRALVKPAALPFRIHVFGPQGSGKTPFARALGAALGVSVAETSEMLRRRLATFTSRLVEEEYQEHYEVLCGKSAEIRAALRLFGDYTRELKPAVLIEEAASEGGIVVGARRKIEMEAWFSGPRDQRQKDVVIELTAVGRDAAYELEMWRPPFSIASAWTLSPLNPGETFDEVVREITKDIRQVAGL